MQRYTYTGPVDHTATFDPKKVAGKSVCFTGGSNGIGEVCVREFVAAGAYVAFGDLDTKQGEALRDELNRDGDRCAFIQCDVRDWDQQKALFELAKAKSPNKSVDIVCANAGISRSSGDSLWVLDDPNGEPIKPKLNIVDVNMIGTMYTFKLAVHYFRQQPQDEAHDRCFIITGSLVSFIDSPGNWEYTATKEGLRGFMRTVRRNSHEQGIRITYIAPGFVKSAIRTAEYEAWLTSRGVQFAEPADAAKCMLRISTDRTINGRLFAIVPRAHVKEGYVDVDREDFKEGKAEDDYFRETQALQLRIIEDKWLDNEGVRDSGLLKK